MRSSIKLINVLVAALLFVTPLTLASAQSGNEDSDAYFAPATGNVAEPVVLPSAGGSLAGDTAFAETNVDLDAAALLYPEALPVTGGGVEYDSSWTDGPMDLSGNTSLSPEALPVTGLDLSGLTGIDRQTILDEVAAAGGTIVAGMPESLPATGADLTDLMGLDSQTILYWLAASGWNFDLDQPMALPMTGGDLSGLNGIDRQTILDEVAAAGGSIIAAPEVLPVTGAAGLDNGEPGALPVAGFATSGALSDLGVNDVAAPEVLPVTGESLGTALPDMGVYDFAVPSGVGLDIGEPEALPVTGISADVVGFIFDGTTYVPDVAAAALPEALPVTGLDASAMSSDWILQPTWVQADFGFAGYDPIDSVNDAAATLPLALPVTGSSQFIWPDDIPYFNADTQTYNDSGASATSNAPVSLPRTGGDRLDVVGGR